jgi:geranylgeranyl diphosphate synthase type II
MTLSPQQPGMATWLIECRRLVIDHLEALLPPSRRRAAPLYELVLDYPLRPAKALRPALAIATCRALGGALDAIVPTAAVLELYHNAFLLHDDVEDDSELRRGLPTLHREHGVPVAINTGDAMLALALEPLLANIELLGLGRSLRLLELVARMCRESAEGQALELDWISRGRWDLGDDDYIDMVQRKTGWYTFVAPMQAGAIVAGAPPATLAGLERVALALAVAFQVQDDLLNLEPGRGGYGKELAGDLWEGKRTLILLTALRRASDAERAEAIARLAARRPDAAVLRRRALRAELLAAGDLSRRGLATLEASEPATRTEEDVAFLLGLIDRTGAMEQARVIAERHALRAAAELEDLALPPSEHRDVLVALVDHVHRRET